MTAVPDRPAGASPAPRVPRRPVPIRTVSRAAVEALVAQLIASGAVEPPRAGV